MRIMSYNTLFGGFDGPDDTRYLQQIDIILEADPDVLMMQEAKGFPALGGAILHATERRLGRRGFVAEAPATGQHTAIFVKAGIVPITFEADWAHFHHAAAIGTFEVPGLNRPLAVMSCHLCPNSPEARTRETSYLFNRAIDDDYVAVAGDFNSVSPDDEEPKGLEDLPPRFRMRYTASDGRADRSTMASLLRAGYVDVAASLGCNHIPTVPGKGFSGTELPVFRSDYILASKGLAEKAIAYEVIQSDTAGFASDHYPIFADFQLDAPAM